MDYIRTMRELNLSGVDLNLLPPLEALLTHRHVSRAAHAAGLSQPAMSRTLQRLRDLLGDPLLVRTGGGYALTARAEALVPQLAAALADLRRMLTAEPFDPALAQRTLRIAAADTQTVLVAPLMARIVAQAAPGVDLKFESFGPDLLARMESGRLDLVFATGATPLPPGAASRTLTYDRLTLVLRKGHPLADRAWTIEDYGRVDHVGVTLLGDGQSELDAQLAAADVQRRMAVSTPHFTAALAIVAGSDLATTISRRFAERFLATFDVVLIEPPLPVKDLSLTIVWSRLRGADPLLLWLVDELVQAIAGEDALIAASGSGAA
ncbi:LysR substrate-binding domain-containing protein [soil metagenome]